MEIFNFHWLYLVLALVFLSIAVFISMFTERKSRPIGITLFVWFFFAIHYKIREDSLELIMRFER